jgi:hypothetical protein
MQYKYDQLGYLLVVSIPLAIAVSGGVSHEYKFLPVWFHKMAFVFRKISKHTTYIVLAAFVLFVILLVTIPTITGTLTATAGENNISAYGVYNIAFVDGVVYTRTAAGVQAAINSLSGDPGWVILSPGQYAFGATTVTVSHERQHILGAGKWATEIDYAGPGVAFQFSAGAAVLYQCSLEGMSFNGAGDRENANQKIAVQLIDVSEFKMLDIATLHWKGNSSSSSTPSIGLDVQGRELGTAERLSLSADRPVYIEPDPNAATDSLDAWTFNDLYLLPRVPTEGGIVFAPNIVAYHDRFKGIDCVGGAQCINWNETAAVSGISFDIAFEDLHHEHATPGSTYSYTFTRSDSSASYLQNLRIETAVASLEVNGFFLQRTHNAVLINPNNPSTTNTALNADNTNFNTVVVGGYFNTGSTVTNNSLAASTDYNYMPTLSISNLNQPAANTYSGNSTCVSNVKNITFGVAFKNTPVVQITDYSTPGGAHLSAGPKTTGFTVACTGTTDSFGWTAIGNPN